MAQNLPEKNSGRPRRDLRINLAIVVLTGSVLKMDFREYVGKNKLQISVIAVFLLGIFLLAVGGGLFFFKGSTANDDIQIISASQVFDPEAQTRRGEALQGEEVVVHVDGAVVSSGVYKLPSGARVNDAIAAAGGLTGEADGARINLAAKVADGQKIYIASKGQNSNVKGQSYGGEAGASLVSINSASQAELESLPGVGPVTAQKIIVSRPYSGPEELLSKKIVSRSVFEKIREMITVF